MSLRIVIIGDPTIAFVGGKIRSPLCKKIEDHLRDDHGIENQVIWPTAFKMPVPIATMPPIEIMPQVMSAWMGSDPKNLIVIVPCDFLRNEAAMKALLGEPPFPGKLFSYKGRKPVESRWGTSELCDLMELRALANISLPVAKSERTELRRYLNENQGADFMIPTPAPAPAAPGPAQG